MEKYLEDFYNAFNIEQDFRRYCSYYFRGFIPDITSRRILELEEMLLDMDNDCHLEIYKHCDNPMQERMYQYIVIENDYDDVDEHYHHSFYPEPSRTREEALLRYLTHYAHVPYIYENVRKILKVE